MNLTVSFRESLSREIDLEAQRLGFTPQQFVEAALLAVFAPDRRLLDETERAEALRLLERSQETLDRSQETFSAAKEALAAALAEKEEAAANRKTAIAALTKAKEFLERSAAAFKQARALELKRAKAAGHSRRKVAAR